MAQETPFRVLQPHVSTVTLCTNSAEFQAQQQPLTIYSLACASAAAGGDDEVPLVCTAQLAAPGGGGGGAARLVVVAAGHSQPPSCYQLVRSAAAAAAAAAPTLIGGTCSSRRLCLPGASSSSTAPSAGSRWQGVTTRTAATSGPRWQLQPAWPVPVHLRWAWQHSTLLSGTTTATAVLQDAGRRGSEQHKQQLQELQQLIARASAAAAAAASPAQQDQLDGSSVRSASSDPLELLSAAAAAAGLLATATAEASAPRAEQPPATHWAAPSSPVCCSNTLFTALCRALQQQQQQQGSVGQLASSAAQQPACCLMLTGTSSGQVWLTDPTVTLRAAENQQQQQQQQQQQHGMKLLLDMQQPLVAILPVSCTDGAQALLLVGGLGRLLLLQTVPVQQHQQPPQAELSALRQVQLPLQVAAAAVLACNSSRAGQDTNPQALLLLLSTSGQLHAVDLSTLQHQHQPAGAAAAAAAGDSPADAAEARLLPLWPVLIPLPAAVCRLWTLQGSSSSSVVLELCRSGQLLQMDAQDISASLAAASAAAAAEGATADAADAVAAVRQQLQVLVSALETIAAAQRRLQQAAAQQDAYLQGVQHEMDLLGLLQGQHTSTAAAAPEAASSTHMQQQHRHAVGDSRKGQAGSSGLCCSIQLEGLWPVLGAAAAAGSLSPSSSVHLAVSVRLQQSTAATAAGADSSSRRGGRDTSWGGQLGPGWQLVVSFLPEAADSSSVQSTVDAAGGSGSADGTLHASLLLPLPRGCSTLQEGGWVMVYAVKQPPCASPNAPSAPAAAAAAASSNSRESQRQQPQQQQLLPVVLLLGQQYVSVLQLSKMAAANPAAQSRMTAGSSRASVAAGASHTAAPDDNDNSNNSSSGQAAAQYTCLLRLSGRGKGPDSMQQGASTAAAGDAAAGAKRPRHDTDMPLDQQQQQQSMIAQGSAQAPDRQQGAEQVRLLQDWVSKALCLDTGPTAAPPHAWHSSPSTGAAGGGGFSSSSIAATGAAGIRPSAAASRRGLQGHALFALAGGDTGRAAWKLSARPELPSAQLADAAVGVISGGTKHAAAAGAADNSNNSREVSLSVQLQAGRVPLVASMHRVLLLELLQQVEGGSSSSSAGGWRMVSSVPQLKLALARLRQLHEHLLKLQASAAQATGLLQSASAAAGDGDASSAQELSALVVSLEQGLCAAYGRFLLAAGDAAQLAC